MAKQLKVFITYRCSLCDKKTGRLRKTLWETLNKDYAEEFSKTFKTDLGDTVLVQEINEDEI
jgi:hypothetical protein